MLTHRQDLEPGGIRRRFAEPRLRARVAEDVLTFGHPGIGRNRHHGDTGDECAHDGEHGLDGRCRVDREAVGSRDALGHGRRGAQDIGTGERDPIDRDGVGNIVSPRNGEWVQ